MGSLLVVVPQPGRERPAATCGTLEQLPVGPVVLKRLDEPLGLPVGPRRVGARLLDGEAELVAGRFPESRAERRAVVRDHAAARDALGSEPGDGSSEEALRGHGLLVLEDLDVGHTAGVVHADVGVLLAHPATGVGPDPGRPVPCFSEPPELLDVDVEQVSSSRPLVATHRFRFDQSRQPPQAEPFQHGVDGGEGHPQASRDLTTQELLPTELLDRPLLRSGRLAGAAVWARASVLEARDALGPIARQPLVDGPDADPEGLGGLLDAPSVSKDAVDQELSTERGRLRVMMFAHSGIPSAGGWSVVTPSL